MAEWPIEAGPEFVHGGNALLKVGSELLATQHPMLTLMLITCKPLQVETRMEEVGQVEAAAGVVTSLIMCSDATATRVATGSAGGDGVPAAGACLAGPLVVAGRAPPRRPWSAGGPVNGSGREQDA